MRDLDALASDEISVSLPPKKYAETLKAKALKALAGFLDDLQSQPFPKAENVNIVCFRDLYARAIEPLSDRTRQYELTAFLFHRFMEKDLFAEQSSFDNPSHPAYPLHAKGGLDFMFLEMKALIIAKAPELLTQAEIAFTHANRSVRILTKEELIAFIWSEICRVCKLRKSP